LFRFTSTYLSPFSCSVDLRFTTPPPPQISVLPLIALVFHIIRFSSLHSPSFGSWGAPRFGGFCVHVSVLLFACFRRFALLLTAFWLYFAPIIADFHFSSLHSPSSGPWGALCPLFYVLWMCLAVFVQTFLSLFWHVSRDSPSFCPHFGFISPPSLPIFTFLLYIVLPPAPEVLSVRFFMCYGCVWRFLCRRFCPCFGMYYEIRPLFARILALFRPHHCRFSLFFFT